MTIVTASSQRPAGGEINCLDPGGFSAVTITKSITIDCFGTLGSILAPAGTTGVIVNAAGINVILRNLSINGAGAGLNGIRFVQGASLTVDNVIIMNFNIGGFPNANEIKFAPNSANAVLLVRDSYIHSNGQATSTGGGIVVQPVAGGSNALVTIVNSKIQRNSAAGVEANSTSGSIIMTIAL